MKQQIIVWISRLNGWDKKRLQHSFRYFSGPKRLLIPIFRTSPDFPVPPRANARRRPIVLQQTGVVAIYDWIKLHARFELLDE
jgi:hypothetical protein